MAAEDPAEALRSLLHDLQVPEALQTARFDRGIASIGDFAFAYVSIADLTKFSASSTPVNLGRTANHQSGAQPCCGSSA